jgi:phospholipase C
LIISPFARKASVDHTPYDTGSIMRLMIRRFGLQTLPGLERRDRALLEHGQPPMGDLTNALDLVR